MAITDALWGFQKHFLGSGTKFAAITPHDSTDIATTRAVYVGGAGNIVAVDVDGNATTFTAVAAGTLLPIRVSRINATNTTATAMVAIY